MKGGPWIVWMMAGAGPLRERMEEKEPGFSCD
jgi:hypothetical protein